MWKHKKFSKIGVFKQTSLKSNRILCGKPQEPIYLYIQKSYGNSATLGKADCLALLCFSVQPIRHKPIKPTDIDTLKIMLDFSAVCLNVPKIVIFYVSYSYKVSLMLKSKTVFVLGAGASKEVNLPIGSELRKIIAKRLEFKIDTFDHLQGSGDRKLFEMLNSKYRKEINTYLNACRLIRDGIIHADSIDDFIDDHKNNEYVVACGKLAIFMSILGNRSDTTAKTG